jgi:hypothetical protein
MASVNIIGKEYFQSKNSINRLKNDIKSGVDVVKEYLNYLKEGYVMVSKNDLTSITIQVVEEKQMKNKKYFELKMKELKKKRGTEISQKNMFEKAKIKYKIDDEILKLYYDLKKYIDRPVLNPIDAYSNKEQYIPIIEELCNVFKGDNIYSKYYNMLLSSLKNL